jgi:hypothetical protein
MTIYEKTLTLIEELSAEEKSQLLEYLQTLLEHEQAPKQPKRSLLGLWEGDNVSEEEIDEARREMCCNFPREDI